MNWRCTNEIWWCALVTDEALGERCYRKLGYADPAGEVVRIREGISPRQPAGTGLCYDLPAPAHGGECRQRGLGQLQAAALLHQVFPRFLGEVGMRIGPELGEPLGICPKGTWHSSSWGLRVQVLRWLLEGEQGQQPRGPTHGPIGRQAAELATDPGRAP